MKSMPDACRPAPLSSSSSGGATLGQRGHSKDYRPQLNQVVLGIVLDENDRPITSFLWPGNTTDVTTLLPVVERLRSRFGINRACVVADRGMISAATITQLEAQGIDYILGARERSGKEIRETVLNDDGVSVPLIIPRQKGATELAVKEVKIAGRRYIVCRNPEEARKDAETRAKLLSDLARKLSQGDKALVGNNGYRRFLAAPDGAGFAIDPAKVSIASLFFYPLRKLGLTCSPPFMAGSMSGVSSGKDGRAGRVPPWAFQASSFQI